MAMDPKKPPKKPPTLAEAIDDPDAPASAEEIAAATKLRDALADPAIDHEGAALARAAALAHSPRPIDDAEHRAIVERAIASASQSKSASGIARGGGGRVIRVAFGVAAALSVAAAILLVIGQAHLLSMSRGASEMALAPIAPLMPARSTQPLFHEPFARSGGASARIDRIARARASDLRDNRFAMRGVK
jgi:hypothetical protein